MSYWLVIGELLDAGTSVWQQVDVISDILMILVRHKQILLQTKVVLLCNYLQVYRDAEDHSQADLFLASVGVFILMPILVALVAALMFSKDSKNICAAACCLWWLPFSVLVFIFNAFTPLGKLCSQF